MKKTFDFEFEKVVRIIVKYFPVSEENSRKSILSHSIRVGVYLYEKDYSQEIVLGGLLHDVLEWSDMDSEIIEKEFGKEVLKLIENNTKNRDIENGDARIDDLVRRSANGGREAFIIRVADTLDSFKHYTKNQNQKELEYCRKNAEAIQKYRRKDWNDEIFNELSVLI